MLSAQTQSRHPLCLLPALPRATPDPRPFCEVVPASRGQRADEQADVKPRDPGALGSELVCPSDDDITSSAARHVGSLPHCV